MLPESHSEEGPAVIEPSVAWRRAQVRIDRAWYAAVLAAVATLILGGLSARAMEAVTPQDYALVADAGLVLLLARGITPGSQVAAGLLLVHLVITVASFAAAGAYGYASLAALLFGPIYGLGLVGTVTLARFREAGAGEVGALRERVSD